MALRQEPAPVVAHRGVETSMTKLVGFTIIGDAWHNGQRDPGWNIAILETDGQRYERFYSGSESMQAVCEKLKAHGVENTNEFQKDFISGKLWREREKK